MAHTVRVLFISAILSLSLLPTTATGTTVLHYDLPQLAEKAYCIFNGVCRSAEGLLVDGRAVTRYTFDVSETLKGPDLGGTILLSLKGGVVGDRRTQIVGMPEFAPGEETVLFLTRPDATGAVWPVGLAQGVFVVDRGPTGDGAPRVFQDASTGSLKFAIPGSAAKSTTASQPGSAGFPLRNFLSTVKSLVGVESTTPE